MLNQHLIVKTEPCAINENIILWNDIRVTVLSEDLFRIEKDTDKQFCDKATQTVWFRNMPPVSFTVAKGKKLTVKTAKATLTVKEDIMKSTVTVGGKTVVLEKNENLPGAYRSLDCCNGDFYSCNGEQYTIKLEDGIVSKSGVGIHDDTDSLILREDGRLHAREDDDRDLYIFAHGKDFRGALRNLYMISGNVPLIPKYAFGNWWSRYHAYSDKEYLRLLDRMTEHDIPITVATIDMDWHWSTTLDERKGLTASGKVDGIYGPASGWTGYSWNTDLFPDYKAFLQKIRDRNLKITLNLHPASGIRYFEDMYEEFARAMGVDPESQVHIPFDFTDDNFINNYFDILHKPYEHDGVEFWWIDWQQGTTSALAGLDPLWVLNHYHTLDNAKEHLPLTLSRYCKIGSHRYPLGFSGDTHMTWDSLDYIPYFTAMGTNAGYTWWSHDIGGHMHGFKDDELYMRYIQFGVFSPINRLHCAREVVITKEPLYYMNGKGMIAEEFLRLRHRMIPFLYSASYKTNELGQALIEPMYYAYPDQKDAYSAHNQYIFGENFIVAPITKKGNKDGISSKKVWLPQGKWTDIFTGDEYEGGNWIEMYRWLETIPVLAREGAIFVLDAARHTNKVTNPSSLDIFVFNGNGEYVLHEDCDTARLDTVFTSAAEDGKQTLTISTRGDRAIMPSRTYRLQFRNILEGSASLTVNGKTVELDADDTGDFLMVTLENLSADSVYTVTVNYKNDRRKYRNARLLYNLMRLEGKQVSKDILYHKLRKLTDDEARALISENKSFNKIQKARLNEAW